MEIRFGGLIKSKSTSEEVYGSVVLDIDYDNRDDHKKITDAIKEKHPGIIIYGYCPAKEMDKH